MRKFRTRLALRIAPWLRPARVYTGTNSAAGCVVTWTEPPRFGTSDIAR